MQNTKTKPRILSKKIRIGTAEIEDDKAELLCTVTSSMRGEGGRGG
jgi:hypothetical protein